MFVLWLYAFQLFIFSFQEVSLSIKSLFGLVLLTFASFDCGNFEVDIKNMFYLAGKTFLYENCQ